MMDIGSTELLMIVIVAIVVIGPKDLPRALYKVGQVIGKAKGMARHFRSGIDAMVREVELEEMEKKWKADNERIMREYAAANPAAAPVASPAAVPAPDAPAAMEPLAEPPAAIPAPAAPAAPVTEGER
ncbi:Sec-independent protein translocase protein TatB [Blastomonas sp. UPD001]|jgi:sec-independent protein translocase protein TatB|uniref:Sec-independent protein translocase protein TatB n=1 Tax=Blastomonas sp. UPD001 TaxID=2217673 RepID=UPI000E3485F6|nr:Sec-independent protein translocase protein TatB [Blastomonas sp. UPD001]MBL0965629.1 twin-arginine translocase subunit TatB [Blastomonas sp.]